MFRKYFTIELNVILSLYSIRVSTIIAFKVKLDKAFIRTNDVSKFIEMYLKINEHTIPIKKHFSFQVLQQKLKNECN